MFDTTELARALVGGDALAISLTRDRQSHRETITLVWPSRATVIEPGDLSSVTTAVVVVFATARTQLAAIRAAER
jgi:hypothetical protein